MLYALREGYWEKSLPAVTGNLKVICNIIVDGNTDDLEKSG